MCFVCVTSHNFVIIVVIHTQLLGEVGPRPVVFIGTETPLVLEHADEWGRRDHWTIQYTNVLDRATLSARLPWTILTPVMDTEYLHDRYVMTRALYDSNMVSLDRERLPPVRPTPESPASPLFRCFHAFPINFHQTISPYMLSSSNCPGRNFFNRHACCVGL